MQWFKRFGGTSMQLSFAGATHPGRRDHNEDAHALRPAKAAAVVADGMGGLSRGEVASRLVVDCVIEAIEADRGEEQGLRQAHEQILRLSSGAGQQRMGSTGVALSIDRGKARVSWVGDSRAYLYRSGRLQAITRDHSFVMELVEAGAISEQEAETHPNRNVLTRAIGVHGSEKFRIDTEVLRVQAGDRLLLCSDGLHGYLSEERIARCLGVAADAGAAAQDLIDCTLAETEAGDNITAICVFVTGEAA